MQKEPVIGESGATMRAIILEDPKVGPTIKEVPVPSPKKKEILIKVECAPVTSFERLQCRTDLFKPPFILGVQASGTVVSLGSEAPVDLLGKKVVVYNYVPPKLKTEGWKGLWCQYVVRNYTEVFVCSQSITHESACTMYRSPLAALSLFRLVQRENHKVVVLTPGTSTISKALTKLLKKSGCTVISIVRHASDMEILKEMGHESVINSSDPDFSNIFQTAVKANNPTLLIDAVGDEISETMFRLFPGKSTHIIYGMLGEREDVKIPLFSLVFEWKCLKGFYVAYENMKDPNPEILKDLEEVDKDLKAGGEVFGVPIVKEYQMNEFMKAMSERPSCASKGRGIIRFHSPESL